MPAASSAIETICEMRVRTAERAIELNLQEGQQVRLLAKALKVFEQPTAAAAGA